MARIGIGSASLPGNSQSLATSLMLVSFGALAIYSGWKGQSLVDVFSGKGKRSQKLSTGSKVPGAMDSNVAGPATPPGVGAVAGPPSPGKSAKGTLRFDGKPVAAWMVPDLKWARKNGWTGRVISGYRTPQEQVAAANGYASRIGSTVSKIYGPNGPLGSNHTGTIYPRGAIDVTKPEELDKILRGRPMRVIKWGGPVINDPPHFSATGR